MVTEGIEFTTRARLKWGGLTRGQCVCPARELIARIEYVYQPKHLFFNNLEKLLGENMVNDSGA